jgi:lipopolysaccharide/colanic/teichoic acid biosynthesis glycosyltransferase
MLEGSPVSRPSPNPREGARARRQADMRRGTDGSVARASAADDIALQLYPAGSPIGVTPRPRSETANRVVNFALAVVAIIILSPILLLVAIVVWATSRGPIIYVQERVGIDRRARRTLAMYDRRAADIGGTVFKIYKFRTMRVDAEQRSGAVWAVQNDPRVTLVGRFLRRTRLDELPQLINVLQGDMNIVGPRPERPTIFMNLRENIAEYPLRQRAKPGITGLAQINHNYDSCLDDVRTKVSYDLQYLAKQSLWEDIKIMLQTIPVMIFKKGGW